MARCSLQARAPPLQTRFVEVLALDSAWGSVKASVWGLAPMLAAGRCYRLRHRPPKQDTPHQLAANDPCDPRFVFNPISTFNLRGRRFTCDDKHRVFLKLIQQMVFDIGDPRRFVV